MEMKRYIMKRIKLNTKSKDNSKPYLQTAPTKVNKLQTFNRAKFLTNHEQNTCPHKTLISHANPLFFPYSSHVPFYLFQYPSPR
jgi:hypothetical protein